MYPFQLGRMYEDAIWCTVTNLFCLLPTIAAYRRKLPEWILYLNTGIASIFYHLHHYNDYLHPVCTFLDYEAIKMVDLVMSDMTICYITSYMLDKNLQSRIFFTFLPFEMYAVYVQSTMIRWIFTGMWISASVFYVIAHRQNYNIKWFRVGLISSTLEILFYEFLTGKFPWYYNWIHAVHHIFGFLGVYFYILTVSSPSFETPSPHHRRVWSHDLI